MAHLKQSGNFLFVTTLTGKMFTFLNENLSFLGENISKKGKCFGHYKWRKCFPFNSGDCEMFPKYPQTFWGKYKMNFWLWIPLLVKFQASSDFQVGYQFIQWDSWIFENISKLQWHIEYGCGENQDSGDRPSHTFMIF